LPRRPRLPHHALEQSESPILKPIWDSLSRGILVFLMQERRLESTYEVSIADHERLVALLAARDAAELEKEIERHVVSYLPGKRAAAKPTDSKRRKAG
jgi:DNA-binding GntR family transcriptional regulator